jgi:hypothetical protein
MKMRRAEDDVALTDGHGYMTSVTNYEAHLAESIENKEVRAY